MNHPFFHVISRFYIIFFIQCTIICKGSSLDSSLLANERIADILAEHPQDLFNFEIGLRVQERLTEFMEKPIRVIESLSNYRNKHIYSHDMQPPDRDIFLILSDTLLEQNPGYDMVYYGLEDGTFMGNFYEPRVATYREPGMAGYKVFDGEAGDVQKYFDACVDESGAQVPCVMRPGEKYIECIDGCSLQKCKNEDSQKQCSILFSTEEERKACEADVTYCHSYVEKELPPEVNVTNSTQDVHGFIPRSYFCVDKSGTPSQELGKISKHRRTAALGNCYYQDGETLVNRTMSGDYEYCKSSGQCSVMERSSNCSHAFHGAYRAINYDHRYRSWYKNTRLLQRPQYTPPYIFFTSQEMGITITKPIFSDDNTYQKIFYGVLGIDYTFDELTRFLIDAYGEADTIIAVIEKAEYDDYLIASSTGTSGAKKVLASDNTQPCPSGTKVGSNLCTAIRASIKELSENQHDDALSAAYTAQAEERFLDEELVATETSGVIYVSQTVPFTMAQVGIDWRILVASPLSVEKVEGAIMSGDPKMTMILVPAITGALICFIFLALFVKNRKERDVAYGDWRFTTAFLVGCILLNLSCISFLGPNSDELCLLRMWLIHFCFVSSLAPLLVKVYRMYLLVGRSTVARRAISHAKAAIMTAPFIVIELLILLVFTFIDPNKKSVTVDHEGADVTFRVICDHDTQAFFIVQFIYEGLLIVLGCILSFKTRNMKTDFGEAKQLILAMYNIAVIASIILIASKVMGIHGALSYIFITVGIWWSTVFSSAVFVLPRLLRVHSGQGPQRVLVTGLNNA